MGPAGDGQPDIARNVRTIEWLKAELAGGISNLYRALIRGREEPILDALASILVSSYVLGRRVGLDFDRLDRHVRRKLQLNVRGEHEVERWYGDLSELLAYFERTREAAEEEVSR